MSALMLTLLLARDHPAARQLPRLLAITGGTASLVLTIIALFVFRERVIETPLFIALIWLTPAVYLLFADTGTRCTLFELALPIPSRRLWLAHTAAITGAGLVILVITGVLGTIIIGLLNGKVAGPLLEIDRIGNLAIQLVAALVLAVMILQAKKQTRHSESGSWTIMALRFGAVIAGGASVMWLTPLPMITALIPFGAAIGLGLWSRRNVPVAYSVTPESVDAPVDYTAADWASHPHVGPSNRRRFNWLLIRTIFQGFTACGPKKIAPWITLPLIVAIGASLSGIVSYLIDETMRFHFLPMIVYMLLSFSLHAFTNMSFVDALPIQRSRFLAILVVPYAIALVAGYGLGAAGKAVLDHGVAPPHEPIQLLVSEETGHYSVNVPIEYGRISWNGDVPDAVAPWGETHEMWSTLLYKGGHIKLYLPAGFPADATADFVALQLSRATERVYGEPIPPEEIMDRYLGTQEDGRIELTTERLTIGLDHPHLRPLDGGPVFPVLITASLVFWLLLLGVYVNQLRTDMTRGRRLRAMWSVLSVLLVFWIGQFALAAVNIMDTDHFRAFVEILLRQAGSTAFGTAATWAGCLAVLGAAYGFALSRLRRAEAPYKAESCGS